MRRLYKHARAGASSFEMSMSKQMYPYKWVPDGLEGGPPVRNMTDVNGIKADLKKWGFFRAYGTTKAKSEAEIKAIYAKQIANLGWSEEYTMRIYDADGSLLDVNDPTHHAAFVAAVTRPLTRKELDHMLACSPPGKTFGRPCCPGAAMTPLQVELRNCLEFNKMMRAAMGLEDDDGVQVFCGIEGYILRLPTMGQFCEAHLDMSAYVYTSKFYAGDESIDVFQLKYNLEGECTFTCVPGSQSFEFRGQFIEEYADDYDLNSEETKFQISKNKPDPMGILANKKVFKIGPREIVGWVETLIHTHTTVPRASAPVMGGLMGGIKATPERAKAYLYHAGIPEYLDRYLTWRDAHIGRCWPSLSKSAYRMENAVCYPKIEKDLIAKLPDPIKSNRIKHYTQSNGTQRQELLPPDTAWYVPPHLTAHGIEDLLCYSQEEGAQELRVEAAIVQSAVLAAEAAGTPTLWKTFLTQPLKWNREDLPPRPTAESRRAAARAAAAANPKPAPKRQRKAKQAPLSAVMVGKQAADAADDSDSDAGAAGAGWKRKRNVALDSSDEDEPAAAPGPVGGAAGAIDLTFSDSDDDVIVLSD